jgi:hypothetical protein
VYVTGTFSGSADFTGDDVADLVSAGSNDVYFLKLDSSTGATVWFKRIGGAGNDVEVSDLGLGTGSIFATGGFSGTVDVDPGQGTVNLTAMVKKGKNAATATDGFVLALDKSGNFERAWRFGGTNPDRSMKLAVDGSNLYVTGIYEGTVDFDPSPNTASRTSAGVNDHFFASYTTLGQLNWVQSIGSATNVEFGFQTIAVNATHLYLGGDFYTNNYDVDPTSAVLNLGSNGVHTGYVVRYHKSTGLLDSSFAPRQFGGAGASLRLGYLTLDDAGSIYVSGYIENGIVDLNPGSGVVSPSLGGYVLKLSAAGEYSNHWEFGTTTGASISLVKITRVVGDTMYIAGSFSGTIQIPGGGPLTSLGDQDSYIIALDQSSEPLGAMASAIEGQAMTQIPARSITQASRDRRIYALRGNIATYEVYDRAIAQLYEGRRS